MFGKNNGVAAKIKKQNKFEGMTSFLSLQFIHQLAMCGKSLRINHVVDNVIKSVNFIRARALDHREFVALLEEEEVDYGVIFYHTNMRWLIWGLF
jgi:hypothetical protein